MLGVSIPALVVDEANPACCCASEESMTKISVLTLTISAPQGPCCSGVEATSAASAAAPTNDGAKGSDSLNSVTFRIDGTSCSCEGQIVEKRVKALKGVKTFSLNPITNQMRLTYDPSVLSVQDIQMAVKKAGANAVLVISK